MLPMKKKLANCLLGGVLAACAGTATADYDPLMTFAGCDSLTCRSFELEGTGSNSHLEALVVFEVFGGDLLITLANMSGEPISNNADVLTALFFNLYTDDDHSTLFSLPTVGSTAIAQGTIGQSDGAVDDETFTSQTRYLVSGSSQYCDGVVNTNDADDPCKDEIYNVGGEWGYNGDIAGGYNGFSMGIGSAGLAEGTPVFGGATFNGPDLDDPAAVNGGNYGIASRFDITAGNVTYDPLTQNAVQFKFDLTPAQLDSLDLSTDAGMLTGAGVQYGTDQDNPFIPIPGTLALLALGFVGLGWIRNSKLLGMSFGPVLRKAPC